jgi:hypothetical protein
MMVFGQNKNFKSKKKKKNCFNKSCSGSVLHPGSGFKPGAKSVFRKIQNDWIRIRIGHQTNLRIAMFIKCVKSQLLTIYSKNLFTFSMWM